MYSVDYHPDPLIFDVWHNQRRYVKFIAQDVWAFVPEALRARAREGALSRSRPRPERASPCRRLPTAESSRSATSTMRSSLRARTRPATWRASSPSTAGVMLYGDSGAGKSSLINAGLLPEATRLGFHPERLRVQPRDRRRARDRADRDRGRRRRVPALAPRARRTTARRGSFSRPRRSRSACARRANAHRPLHRLRPVRGDPDSVRAGRCRGGAAAASSS